jgi:hypothetical protein
LAFPGKVRVVRRVTLTLAAFAVLGLWAQAAPAAKPCWQVLVDDWSDGAISSLYPIHCYRQALQHMPEDVRLYSSATDDINRALAGRAAGRSIAGGVTTPEAEPVAAAAVTGSGASGAPFVLAGMLAGGLVLVLWAGWLARRKWRGAARLGGPHG